MILGFGNNVVSSLASDITASQTTFSVIPGDGPLFASLLTSDFSNKSTTLKNYAKITLTDSGETAFEVCHLTAVSGDTLTVIRGQEGTAAKGWALKDVVANFATRGSENAFPQIAHIQSGFYTSGTAGGTANALTLELPTTFFLNGSADWVLKTPIVVYPSLNNTGAATLQLTMGGRVIGTFPLYKGNKAALVANDILKDVALVCLLDNTKTFFNVANPGAIYAGLGTAAFKDIVTSPTDTTAGRVLTVGYHGLGGVAPRTAVAASSNYDNIPTGLKSGFWTHAVSGGPYAYTFTLFQDGGAQAHSRHLIIPSNPTGKIAFRWDGATGTDSKDYQYFFTDKNPDTSKVAKAGDTMTGQLIMNVDGEAIRLKPKTAGYASYILSADSANANHWYVGAGSSNNADTVFNNYKGGNNSVILKADGSVTINPTQGKSVIANGPVQIGGIGNAILNIGDNDSGLRSSVDGQVDLWSNSAKVGFWNKTTFSFTGQIIPTNYSNFDARFIIADSASYAGFASNDAARPYMRHKASNAVVELARKGDAYTKTESDGRYGVMNGFRRGGQQLRNPTDAWFGNWESPAGCVVTGITMDGRSDGRKLGVYYRQMQYFNKLANSWINVGD